MENLVERQKEALKLIERLIELEPDTSTLQYAHKMRERLKLPMSVVLDKVYPDLPVAEKAKRLGVTRQAYYGWLNGMARPSVKISKKLATLTGYSAADIRGQLPAWR
jgi:transcriptional regulator with XRE-family HTH domain